MKVAQLRRLRTLGLGMRSAASADALEWYARSISGLVAEIDENRSAIEPLETAPGKRERIGTDEAALADEIDAVEADATLASNSNPAEKLRTNAAPPSRDRASRTESEQPAQSREPAPTIGKRHVSRETPKRQPNDRHPLFRDDPRAVAECERDRNRRFAF